MRKTRLMLSALLLSSLAVASCQGAVELTKNGASDYVIVLGRDASPSEHRAAAEFKRFIYEMSGAVIPYAPSDASAPGKSVLIGDSPALRSLGIKIDYADLGNEGYTIKTAADRLIITGGKLRGTMYGVYGFLEDILGCRWYTAQVSKIPHKPTITLPDLDITDKPAFEYREPFFTEAWDKDWAARNRCNGASMRLDAQTGGKVTYYPFVHSFAELVPIEDYWAAHPEYFSMIDGKRTKDGTQLCMSDPEVVKVAARQVLEWMEDHPEAMIFSVSQNDWYGNCQCERCQAIDKEESSPSGLLLRFVNAIAEETEKVYPDKLIDTLAYQWTEKPPRITKPRHNVRVRLCPIACCESHPYEKCDNPANVAYLDNLRNWAKITNKLYIWHYNTSFSHYLNPFPDLRQLADSAKLYKKAGVVGIFWEGCYSDGGGGAFSDVKTYMLAKLSWNPDRDADAIVREFLDNVYGKGGKYLYQYSQLLHGKVTKDNIHVNIWAGPTEPFLTPPIIDEADRLFAKARAAAESPEVLDRIEKAYLSIEYVKLMRPILQKEVTPANEKEMIGKLDTFVEKCKAHGITQLNEGSPIDSTHAAVRNDIESIAAAAK